MEKGWWKIRKGHFDHLVEVYTINRSAEEEASVLYFRQQKVRLNPVIGKRSNISN